MEVSVLTGTLSWADARSISHLSLRTPSSLRQKREDFLPLRVECFFSLVHFHLGFFINVFFGKQLAKLVLISQSKS